MKNYLSLWATILLLPLTVQASPFYRETFRLCSMLETSSKNAMDIAGWKAFKGDSPVGKIGFLKINTPGSPDHPVAFSSFPVGPEEGAAFWSKNTQDLTIFSDEFSFDVGSLALVQYQQRLSGLDSTRKNHDGTQLALLIGNTWYISDQMVRQRDRGVWESVSLAPSQLTYGTSPNTNGRGPKKPGNFNVKLPSSGIVTAFGVFINKVHGRVRIDNFTLSDLVLENRTPGEQGSANQCSSINLPGGNVNGQGSEPEGKFCSGRSARALGKVSTSKSLRSKLLLSVGGKTLQAKRDRAVLALLLSNNLRVDNLVNVTISDYFTVGSIQLLNASGVAKQTTPVKPSVKRLVDEYIDASGSKSFGKLPLFQSIDKKSDKSTGSALCTGDIATLVKRQARIIKASNRVTIKS